MSSVTRLRAGAPLPRLVDSLAKCGWGLFQKREYQGVRAVLNALAALLPADSAQSRITVNQIATVTGHSRRWTSTLLAWLEDAELIEWRRGEILAGKPTPGYLRLSKGRLVDLIKVARPENDRTQAERRERERLRLARLGTPTFRNRHPRRSPNQLRRWEVSGHLSLSNKGNIPRRGVSAAAARKDTPLIDERDSLMLENEINAQPYLPDVCPHGRDLPKHCNACRTSALREAWKANKAKENQEQRDQQLLRDYAAAVYPDRPFKEIYRYVRADYLAGDVHAWQRGELA